MNESTLRNYLLGRLSEAEAQQLEEQALADDDLFTELKSVEDDLVDEHARGELPDYKPHASRVVFARALAKRASNVVPFARRRFVQLAAAAAIVLIATALLVMRRPPEPAPIARRVINTPAPFVVALTLATSRAATPANTITIPRDAKSVRFQVHLDPNDRFDSYRVEIQSSRGVAWNASALRASEDEGALLLRADVPASALSDGSYELAIHGDDEDLGAIPLEVHR